MPGGTDISIPLPRRGAPPYELAVLRELFASLPAAVAYLSGPDLVIDFANDACRELVGDRDLVGRPLGEALPELAEQGEVEILTRILDTGEPVRGSEAGVRIYRDGCVEQRFVDYVYQPVPGGRGRGDIAGVLLYAADVTAHVTDRLKLEALAAELAAAEERLRALFETMPTGVVHYGADGTVLGTNPAARRLLGLSEAEMTSWPLATVRHAVHGDGTPFSVEELPVSRALRTGEMACDVMMGVRHGRTGELRWLQATAVPGNRDGEGRPQRVYVMFTDLTEQRQVEAVLARERAREHAIAETLQRSILPDTLPDIPGLDLAVRYLPATEGANVGGDWYDAFGVEGGRIALVTGDVAGHSIGSASVMGQLRNVLRAYAVDNPDPARVLRLTNTALWRLLPQALASVVYGVLDLTTSELAYANAGHPPPVLLARDGEAHYLDDTDGIMLGACADATFTTSRRRLPPGATLLCYTDGLIENRQRDISEGLARLAETLQRAAPDSADAICAAAEATLLGTAERADDVCMLAARLAG